MIDQQTAAGLVAFVIALVGATKFLITVKNPDTENSLIRLYSCIAGALAFAGYAATHAAAGVAIQAEINTAVSAAGQGFIAGGAAALAVKLYHVAQDAGAVPNLGNVAALIPGATAWAEPAPAPTSAPADAPKN